MTPEQAAQFSKQGYLYLPGALSKEVTRPVKAHVLNALKKQKIWSGGRPLSNRMQGIPAFQQVTKLGQLISYPRLKARLISNDLHSAMHKLAGTPLVPEPDGRLLLSLPHQGSWTLEELNWHRDIAQSKMDRLPGIQVFALIADLSAHGGATLALAGSHRITRHQRGRQIIRKFLSSAAGDDATMDGIPLSILEMTGRAGDVYLMDMRLIHTPSFNSTKRVRMMATIRYFTR